MTKTSMPTVYKLVNSALLTLIYKLEQ